MSGDDLSGDELLAAAKGVLDEVVALRREIHRDPELGLDLPRTQARVLRALDGLPLTISTGTGQTSVVADLVGARPGPTVLLRADMDALPMPEDTGLGFASTVDGAMHACGHDAHTAMLVGAAKLLSQRTDQLAGRVRFLFQPGEEGAGGARIAIEEGVLGDDADTGDDGDGAEPVSWAFAIHQSPSFPAGLVATRAGALLASADEFRVVVRGRGGHASMPHHANDPIPVACEVVQALQTWVTRRVDVFDPAVITVGRIAAGTATNVIPETAVLDGTIRTVSAATRDRARAAIGHVAEHVAAAHEMAAETTLKPGYPVTVNDAGAAAEVLATAAWLFGTGTGSSSQSGSGRERDVHLMPAPFMGAEDFSYVLERVPGAMAFLGTRPAGTRGAEAAPNHSNRMVLDEPSLAVGVGLYAAAALRHLEPAGWQEKAGSDP